MRKFLISIISIFIGFSVFAAGENVTTSKSYVDSILVPKQDIIEGTNDAPRVLTNTGTAGEYGTKDIYDSTDTYSGQMDALIDAVTMNTAVQNAIDSEFQCVEYNPNDPTDCWLMDIRGVTGKSILPAGYTALEYIESTGTQYIDTGVVPTINTVWKLDNEFSTDTISGEYWYNGVYQNSGARFDIALQQNDMRLNYGAANIVSSNVLAFQGVRIMYTIDAQKLIWSYGNTRGSYTRKIQGFTQPLYLFARNDLRSSVRIPSRFSLQKTYSSRIFDNDVLVQYLIPARHDSDNEIGMYDLVSNTFFTNSGTGEFTAGPVANLYLPSGN